MARLPERVSLPPAALGCGVRWLDAAFFFCVSFGVSNGGGCRTGAERAEPKRRRAIALQKGVPADGPRESQTNQIGPFAMPSERV